MITKPNLSNLHSPLTHLIHIKALLPHLAETNLLLKNSDLLILSTKVHLIFKNPNFRISRNQLKRSEESCQYLSVSEPSSYQSQSLALTALRNYLFGKDKAINLIHRVRHIFTFAYSVLILLETVAKE
jgi:hypothetical protein